MAAPQAVRRLVDKYEAERHEARTGGADAARVRAKYVRDLLKLLAWENQPGLQGENEAGTIVHEHRLQTVASQERRPPQYSLLVGGVRKCFVAIAPDSPSVDDHEAPAFHLRRFAWSADVPASLLSDFEDLSIYSGRVRPHPGDAADAGLIQRFSYTDYEAQWDDLAALLSPEAIKRGELDRRAAEMGGVEPVDDAFLDELERWRKRLGQSLHERNPSLSIRGLNTAVQLLIDRIVFLRICEDRGIESYGRLRTLHKRGNAYQGLLQQFDQANAKYNAGLFRFDGVGAGLDTSVLSPSLRVDNDVLREMLRALYAPESPYEFSVVSADILGQVYERFLGNEIVPTAEGGVTVEQKPEVRKSGGVYYTPSHVVESIVKATVDKLCEGKTPEEVAQIRILDPSCGSGSFLNAAYQHLLDWHRRYYLSSGGAKAHPDRIRGNAKDGYDLTFEERKRILQNNIYGVDIDAQAIEITKLSLLLKVLEGESQGMRRAQLVIVQQLLLPDLDTNIQCGNSLIGPDFGARTTRLTEEERPKFVPFDYTTAFPRVFGSDHPGFDAVIGNPPYLSYSGPHSITIPHEVRAYFKTNFRGFRWPSAQAFFIERSIQALTRRYLSFIVPDQIGHLQKYGQLRAVLQENARLVEVRYWGEKVFKGVTTPALTFVADKQYAGPTAITDRDGSLRRASITGDAPWNISGFNDTLQKLQARSFSLGNLVKDCGIMTADSKKQIVPLADATDTDIPVLEGEQIQRYACTPPTQAVRPDPTVRMRRSTAPYEAARFLIRQTAAYPIVGPKEHAVYFRNSLLALYAPEAWPDVKYLAGLLNSRLLRFAYTETIRASRQQAFTQVTVGALRSLPIRELDREVPEDKAFHDAIVRNVDEILALHRALADASGADRDYLERQVAVVDEQIDRLVFRLYGLSREEVALVNRALGHAGSEDPPPDKPIEEMTYDELWKLIDRGPGGELWRDALEELVAREDPFLAPHVAEMLRAKDLAHDTRCALVLAAEQAHSYEVDVRRALTDGLLSAAIALRDAGEGRPLWAAIRRYASLVPVEEVDALLSFLRDEDLRMTKQATFQAIQNIFTVDSSGKSPAVAALRARVHALAEELIAPSLVAKDGGTALALEAFCAAAALRDSEIDSLEKRVDACDQRYLTRRAREFLRSLRSVNDGETS